MFNTIRARLYFFTGLFVVIAGVQVGILWHHAASILENNRRITQVLVPTQAALHQLEINVIQIQQWLTDMSATRGLDGLDDGPAKATENYNAARTHLKELSTLHPRWQSELQKIGHSLDGYYSAGKEMAHAYVNGGPQAGNPMMAQFDTTAERIANDIAELQGNVSQLETEILAAETRDAESSSTLVVVFLAMYIAMACGLLLLLQLVVLKPINFLQKKISSLNAGNANLSARFDVQGDDEIGQIQTEFNTLLDTLEKTYRDIGKHSGALSNSIAALNRTVVATEAGVKEQESQLEQVSAAITEMAQTSQEVKKNTEVAASETMRMAERVRAGTEITAKTAQSFRQIAQKIGASADTVTQLERDTTRIQSVLDVIRGIAEQTNLLALNAAIEAARAGEQGRGFAVVADEVRSLAGRTQESTTEIRGIIESLQGASANAVSIMKTSMLDIDHCVEESGHSKMTMEDIGRAMGVVNDLILQIATAMEEQAAVANTVSRSVVAVRDIALDTSGQALDTGRQTAALAQQALDMQKLAGALGRD